MKKKKLNTLKLNKKSISNFQVKGGLPPTSYNCVPIDPYSADCEPIKWLTEDGRHICRTWN
ncbi:hypothetical protein [Kordia zhangzhouensis]|uniref:hypothetical protein n=1 Tax=Kordia zhangzhouensis TaxID=1620405 RepID=UPI0006295DB9|nr:hypothetical protein [Kordia zhangzhouensis]